MTASEMWVEVLRRGGYFGLPPREQVAVDAKIRFIKTLRRLGGWRSGRVSG